MKEHNIFLNTLYQIVGKIIISFLGIITTAYLTRYLGETGFGEYSLIFTFVGFVAVFADFGLATILTREIAANKKNISYVPHVFSLRLWLSLFVLGIGIVVSLFMPYSYEVKVGITIASVSSLILLLASVFWAALQAKYEFKHIVVSQVISSVVLFLLVALGLLNNYPLLYYVTSAVVSGLVGLLVAWIAFGKIRLFLVDKSVWRLLLKESWPIGLGVILSVVYFRIDSIMLSLYYNPAQTPDLGYYSLSYKIFEVAIVFGGYFIQTLFPFFSQNLRSKNFLVYFKKYLVYTLLLSAFIGLGLFLFSDFAVLLLGGEVFSPSAQSVRILSLAAVGSILAGFFLNIAIAGRRQKVLLVYAFAALMLNVFLNMVLLPKYSYIGASWSTVITQTFILIAYIVTAINVVKNRSN